MDPKRDVRGGRVMPSHNYVITLGNGENMSRRKTGGSRTTDEEE